MSVDQSTTDKTCDLCGQQYQYTRSEACVRCGRSVCFACSLGGYCDRCVSLYPKYNPRLKTLRDGHYAEEIAVYAEWKAESLGGDTND